LSRLVVFSFSIVMLQACRDHGSLEQRDVRAVPRWRMRSQHVDLITCHVTVTLQACRDHGSPEQRDVPAVPSRGASAHSVSCMPAQQQQRLVGCLAACWRSRAVRKGSKDHTRLHRCACLDQG
jgi:hypothetical protein